jgi:gas vesicle protein
MGHTKLEPTEKDKWVGFLLRLADNAACYNEMLEFISTHKTIKELKRKCAELADYIQQEEERIMVEVEQAKAAAEAEAKAEYHAMRGRR